MPELDSSVCIYCRKEGSSREHVAPFALGGNCVIKCVCRECNTKLSSVDQAIAEKSPVALSKVGMTPATSFATQLGTVATMRDGEGFDLGVRVGNEMTVEVRPQMFIVGNQIRVSCPDREGIKSLVDFIDKRIETRRLASVHQRISPETRNPRFMMHRSNDAVVDARSSEEANQLLATIEKNWEVLKATLSMPDAGILTKQDSPSVLIEMRMSINEEYRAVAKIAFETAALLLGSDCVLKEPFDPLRAYILGDVRLPNIEESDLETLAIDSRFVGRIAPEDSFDFTEQHGVILFHGPEHGLGALVVLYGLHHYRVRLSSPLDQLNWTRYYEFSYAKDGHRELSEIEFAGRALERFPHVLKISSDVASKMLNALRGDEKPS